MALAIASPMPAFADSSFRGFTVSDSPEQVDENAKAQAMSVSWGAPPLSFDTTARQATIVDGDNACAWITFNRDEKIDTMLFASCFFGAEGLGLRQVTQEFINKFGGSAEMEIIPEPACKNSQPFLFKGRTSEGELFQIKDDCSLTVKIEPGSGKGLRF
jgi:hypothetical protein